MKIKKVCIIDYDAVNIGSIVNAVKHLKMEFEVLKTPRDINSFSHMILPGVGSFNKAMKIIIKNRWDIAIKEFINYNKPFLGICLGMQLMFEKGTEGGDINGLGLFNGTCEIFKQSKFPIPHIGFNLVVHNHSSIWKDIKNLSSFYFVHSYRVIGSDSEAKVCKTDYGEEFVSFIEKNKIYGAQFHPEKSHKVGLQLLKNFLESH